MCAMREDEVLPPQRYTSKDVNLYSRNSAHGTNRKEDSPVQMARRVVEVTLTGCVGVFRGVDA